MVLGRGSFHAEATYVELGSVTLQWMRESLPRLAYHTMQPGKVGFVGWPRGRPLPVIRGSQMRDGELMSHGRGMESHHQTTGPNEFVSLSLDGDALSRVAVDVLGRDLEVASGRVLRPSEVAIRRLAAIIDNARDVARTSPQVFADDEAARGLEQSLLRALLACTLDVDASAESPTFTRRARIMTRFEAVVEANATRALYLPELCRMVGVAERTLRKCCQQHLGMSPHQYLIERRMRLARNALLRDDPDTATVTSVATRFGFWQLGRFSALYRSMFGELPSRTLRRSV